MEIKKKEVEVYIVEGKEFLNKEEALAYQKDLTEKLGYWYYLISTEPDLNEGRGYWKQQIVGIKKDYSLGSQVSLWSYLYLHLGRPIAYVLGVQKIPAYTVSKAMEFDSMDELNRFFDKNQFFKNHKIPIVYYEVGETIRVEREG